MIHPRATSGTEPCDDGAGWTLNFGGMSARIGASDGLGHFDSGIGSFEQFANRNALAGGFVDGCAGSSLQAAQHAAFDTVGILHAVAAATPGSLRHASFLADPSIGTQARAIEPCFVKILANLHVKTDGDRTWLAHRVGRRPSARASPEVVRHPLVGKVNPVAITIAVTIAITVTVAILILRRSQRHEGDEQESGEEHRDSGRPASAGWDG